MFEIIRVARWLAPLALIAAIATAGAQTAPAPKTDGVAVATFAGGCFWCVEEAFEKVPGVIRAVSGYTGGTVDKPTYEEVSSKSTGHFEAVQVTYDASKVSYPQLVDWFWRNIDPVDAKGQFCDKGSPYYTGIFTHDEGQKKVAEESKQALEASGRFKEKIATKILPAGPFWVAEDYHQDYYKKNPHRYLYYKTACGRAARLEQIWGPPTKPPSM
jgi:peptide-methionine (S)-S-oxide reductase